jgi:hypothetical protein
MEVRPEVRRTVELREPYGGQPAGAVGTVVELMPREVLVEVADEHGRTVERLTVPNEALRVRESEPTRRRATG